MDKFENQGGVSFLLVHFLFNDSYFCLSFKNLKAILSDSQFHRKSIPYKSFDNQIFISDNYFLNYLEGVNKILRERVDKI